MKGEQALHLVYINTLLETKAMSASTVPTITCKSPNVPQSMLQASSQIRPDLKIMYGPNTGNNLVAFFDTILDHWTVAKELYPVHNLQTIQQLREK